MRDSHQVEEHLASSWRTRPPIWANHIVTLVNLKAMSGCDPILLGARFIVSERAFDGGYNASVRCIGIAVGVDQSICIDCVVTSQGDITRHHNHCIATLCRDASNLDDSFFRRPNQPYRSSSSQEGNGDDITFWSALAGREYKGQEIRCSPCFPSTTSKTVIVITPPE